MAFQKGQSGNPNGKPKGTRHRVTMAAETLMEGEAEAITRKAIELAKEGDGPALRLCMDRIYPPRKDRPVRFRLPSLGAKALIDVSSGLSGAAKTSRYSGSQRGLCRIDAVTFDLEVLAVNIAETA